VYLVLTSAVCWAFAISRARKKKNLIQDAVWEILLLGVDLTGPAGHLFLAYKEQIS
jgi:hypothetical protein